MIAYKGGKLVSTLRERAKDSQKEVADKVGISQPYLSAIENGSKLNPSVDVLKKLADVLGFTMNEFVEGKEV